MKPRLLIALAVIALSLTFASSVRTARAATIIFQTDMYGTEQVPPVSTVAWGYVRFFFDETGTRADYTVDVKGVSGSLVTGADIHRAPRGTNGPVIYHLADGGFIVTAGKIRLTPAEIDDIAQGNWYVSLSTTLNPEGEIRGQVSLPANFPRSGGGSPPARGSVQPDIVAGSNLPVVTIVATGRAAQLDQPSVGCAGGATATFSWLPAFGAAAQWLDIDETDSSFAPDAFFGVGPLNSTRLVVAGLRPGVTYYWRVNSLMADGWLPSQTGAFIPCA